MIVMDTHIWVWWIHNDDRLTDRIREYIKANEDEGLGVSVFSCWEVAKLVEKAYYKLLKEGWISEGQEKSTRRSRGPGDTVLFGE